MSSPVATSNSPTLRPVGDDGTIGAREQPAAHLLVVRQVAVPQEPGRSGERAQERRPGTRVRRCTAHGLDGEQRGGRTARAAQGERLVHERGQLGIGARGVGTATAVDGDEAGHDARTRA